MSWRLATHLEFGIWNGNKSGLLDIPTLVFVDFLVGIADPIYEFGKGVSRNALAAVVNDRES
jgi:hypothetical protein